MIHVLNNSLAYAIMSMSHQFVCVIDQFAIAASVFSGLNDFITFLVLIALIFMFILFYSCHVKHFFNARALSGGLNNFTSFLFILLRS